MEAARTTHIRDELNRYLEGGCPPTDVRPLVFESWYRSIASGVAPDRWAVPYEDRADRAANSEPLIRAAEPVVSSLMDSIHDSDVALLLADAEGWLLQVSSRGSLHHELSRLRAQPGFCFAEEYAGTNAIGTAIELQGRDPVQLYGGEHFVDAMRTHSCVAAAVRHPISQRTLGYVDFTCRADRTSEIPTLTTTVLTIVQAIEQRLLLQASRTEQLLLDSFVARSNRRRPVLAINAKTIIANAAASRVIQALDQSVLWEQIRQTLRDHGDNSFELATSHDEVYLARCRAIHDGTTVVGSVVELTRQQHRQKTPGTVNLAPARESPAPGAQPLVGSSAAWQQAMALAEGLVAGHVPLLLSGERSVGRRTVARWLASHYGPKPPLEVDCAQPLPRTLAGLRGDQPLLLWNLDEMLEVGAERLFAALNPLTDTPISKIIIGTAAGPLDLPNNPFGGSVELPPLRQRLDDVIPLVEGLLSGSTNSGAPVHIRPEAAQLLMRCRWPGNVQELRRVIRAAAAAAGSSASIRIEHLPFYIRQQASSRALSPLEQAECDAILRALDATGGNKVKCAELLQISRARLYRKLRLFSIDLESSLY